MWICPSCQTTLNQHSSTWACQNGHRFDIAKEGYVNLLLANQKRTKDPGDNNAMINARRAFLEQNHYQPLANKVAEVVSTHTPKKSAFSIYDIGCGEGYYLNTIKNYLSEQGIPVSTYGSDIAKNAIQKASKKYKESAFAVASNANLPIESESVDSLIQIFAPSHSDEIARVLKASGVWCQVSPAPTHLTELKNCIYDTPELHKAASDDIDGFTLQHQETLTYQCHLSNLSDRKNLLMMTPFYWSSDQSKIDQIIENLNSVTASFHIKLFMKN